MYWTMQLMISGGSILRSWRQEDKRCGQHVTVQYARAMIIDNIMSDVGRSQGDPQSRTHFHEHHTLRPDMVTHRSTSNSHQGRAVPSWARKLVSLVPSLMSFTMPGATLLAETRSNPICSIILSKLGKAATAMSAKSVATSPGQMGKATVRVRYEQTLSMLEVTQTHQGRHAHCAALR
jgi:hypothetical protein